jgi:hypothetical protein
MPKGQDRPATLGMWWSIEWRGKIVGDIGWGRIEAHTADEARAKYEKEHPTREIRAVSLVLNQIKPRACLREPKARR